MRAIHPLLVLSVLLPILVLVATASGQDPKTAQAMCDLQALALNSQAIVKQTEAVTGALFNFAISALPFVPKADRRQFIELKVDAPGSAGTFLRGSLQSYAEKAPDLSGLQSPLAVSALRLLASQDVLQVKLGEQSTILPPRV